MFDHLCSHVATLVSWSKVFDHLCSQMATLVSWSTQYLYPPPLLFYSNNFILSRLISGRFFANSTSLAPIFFVVQCFTYSLGICFSYPEAVDANFFLGESLDRSVELMVCASFLRTKYVPIRWLLDQTCKNFSFIREHWHWYTCASKASSSIPK